MAIDMKEVIAQAAAKLLIEKKVKRLTVKEIVEECHITRQAFYYHFSDIPDLLQWILQQKGEQLLQGYYGFEDGESRLRYFFLVVIHVMPYVKKGIESNYGDEIERLIARHAHALFENIAEKEGIYQNYEPFERQLILRYHCQAVRGILREWSKEDNKNLDQIVHIVFLMIINGTPRLCDNIYIEPIDKTAGV